MFFLGEYNQYMEYIIEFRNIIIGAIYRNLLKPVFFMQDPEDVHDRMTAAGKLLGSNPVTRGLTLLAFNYHNPALTQTVAGITFQNPLGLAAGFDKEAQLTQILPSVGFGFEEVGSITAKAYEGNPKPRLYRLPEKQALRVYYGLKNSGADNIYNNLQKLNFSFPIGISIAKTNSEATSHVEAGVEDYVYSYKKFSNLGDYVTINISCPNTCEIKPIFADAKNLNLLLVEIFKTSKTKPVFIKLSPDLSDENLNDILSVCQNFPVDGFVCGNLTKENSHNHEGRGGFSGKMVDELSNKLIAKVYKFYQGKKIIIGCGGVFSALDAYKKIKLGASLIQLITGMIYQGPQLIAEINMGLVKLLKKDGFKNISEAIGKSA
jgi:dihydroorotate dehydrogenase